MTVASWLNRLQEIEASGKEPEYPLTKLTKAPSVSSVSTPSPLVSKIDTREDLEPPTDPLAAAALAKLVIDQALRRSVVAHPSAVDYRVGIAVRVPAGGYAIAVLTVPTSDGFAILNAMQRAMP